MRLRISYFNPSVLGKDITRFAPVWALYAVGMLLITQRGIINNTADGIAVELAMTVGLFGVINLFYALVNAALLFGDLFNARLCNALHAMPMRREGWFFTHLAAALLFSIVPNLVTGLCMVPALGHDWHTALLWVGGMTLSYLFFLGAAILSAFCTGNRFGMALVYGILNFLSVVAYWFLTGVYEDALYGITIDIDPFLFLCPVYYLTGREHDFLSLQDGAWRYLAVISVIGIGMMGVAVLLYRRRKLECAGDLISVRPLRPVFIILYTLIAGVVFYAFGSLFSVRGKDDVFLAAGIVLGFLTGQMLLRRTVRVFHFRTFAGLAAVAVVIFGSLWLTRIDVLGITRWIPESPEEVRSVSIYLDRADNGVYTTEDPGEIADLVRIHEEFLSQRGEGPVYWFSKVHLEYEMQDGRTVKRAYTPEGNNYPALEAYFSKPEVVLECTDPIAFAGQVNSVSFHCADVSFYGEDARSLMKAVLADCEAGTMSQNLRMEDAPEAEYLEIDITSHAYRFLTVWEDCTNTIAWMEAHNVPTLSDTDE